MRSKALKLLYKMQHNLLSARWSNKVVCAKVKRFRQAMFKLIHNMKKTGNHSLMLSDRIVEDFINENL